MKKPTRWVGLDVHAETIAVAVAEEDGAVRSLGTVPNEPASVERLVRKLGDRPTLRVCYEAGPCGYVLYWQLTKLGVACEVVAPTLIPVKAGDRVKTDRRDAEKLARCHRSGDLTAVWVPDAEHEALRDLVRAREAAKKDQLRARHRLGKFLLRRGKRRPQGFKAWGDKHMTWLASVTFEHAAASDTFVDYFSEVKRFAERIKRLEKALDEAIEQAPTPHARGHRCAAVAARRREDDRRDDRGRSRSTHALHPAQRADGLQRAGAVGGVERRQDAPRRHHQDGQQSPAPGPGRSRLALPIPARDVCRPSSTPTRASPRRSRRSLGRPSIGSTAVFEHSRRAANRSRKSSRRSPGSCLASSGPSACRSKQKRGLRGLIPCDDTKQPAGEQLHEKEHPRVDLGGTSPGSNPRR